MANSQQKTCPTCKKTHCQKGSFCSKKCHWIDLNRWLTGGYSVPISEVYGDMDEEDFDLSQEFVTIH